ncbi:hypothetical protein KNE206_30710 [Kitasatospora sp. NE20-6]
MGSQDQHRDKARKPAGPATAASAASAAARNGTTTKTVQALGKAREAADHAHAEQGGGGRPVASADAPARGEVRRAEQ